MPGGGVPNIINSQSLNPTPPLFLSKYICSLSAMYNIFRLFLVLGNVSRVVRQDPVYEVILVCLGRCVVGLNFRVNPLTPDST